MVRALQHARHAPWQDLRAGEIGCVLRSAPSSALSTAGVQLAQEKSAVEAESGFQEYTAEHRVVHCPTCKHGLQRSEGCNRLRCELGALLSLSVQV